MNTPKRGSTSEMQQEQQCAITGQLIRSQQPMWLGLTMTGNMIPLSFEMTGYGE
jgi:hypothetical protein